MSISVNTFYAYLSQQLDAGGSETTIYLDRITTRTGETINTADFATVGRGIIAVNPDGDGNTSFPEYISFTGISGLTLTGATRGLSAKSNNVIAANKRFHPVGTPVVIAFGTHSLQDIFDYIDAEIGALTVGSNMVMSGLAGQTVSAGQLVYLNTDGRWWLADADLVATINDVMLGIAQGSGTAGNTITNGILRKGTDANQSGLTAGSNYFVGNTAGAISATAGTNTRKIGVGRSSTQLYFDPEYAQLPTAGEKAALAGGSTFGTPSSSNKYITQDYNASATGLPVVRTYLNAASPATWTKPTGLKYVVVEVQAAGGNGANATTTDRCSAGGGGGGYSKKTIAAASLGTTETVTIGAVGASSSFGSHCSANSGSNATSDSPTGVGAGGSATGGDINIPGQPGNPASTATGGRSGSGGNAVLGHGGRAQEQGADGVAGVGYGGGGSGGAASGTTDQAGGSGAPAVVTVTEYYS